MGAQDFFCNAQGKTAKEAFENARQRAYYDHGHTGYTGSIAEKDTFTVIDVPSGEEPDHYASKLIQNDDPHIRDKWGPAGCIRLGPVNGPVSYYLFFGVASS